jgi:AraC-like DNA-binding protein
LIFFVTVLGIVLSFLIFINRAERFGPNFYFALFFFSHSFFAVTSFAFLSEGYRVFIANIYPYSIILNMASGPFLYIYFKAVFKPNYKFKKVYLLHFLPSLLFFINGFPYLFMDSELKNRLINEFTTNPATVFKLPTLIFPYIFHVIFRVVQSFIYLLLAFRLFINSFKRNKFKFKNDQGYHYSYYCLSFLFAFGYYGTSIYAGLNINPSNTLFASQPGYINSLIASPRLLNALFILTALFHPRLVFEKYFVIQKGKPNQSTRNSNTSNETDGQKYDLDEIERLFTEYMLSKPYLKMGFSLNSISDGTKLPVHQISYFIKQRYNQNFNDWKNELRINHAVELIESGEAMHLTLESISMQCGYRSRANFVDAFKKMKGMPPSEFLAKFNKA